MTNSRRKGAVFERQIAKLLYEETGITFRRNLKQYQVCGQSDLIPDDPDWPFSMEMKAYKSGADCRTAWEDQAKASAAEEGRLPVVIWKYNGAPIRCRIWMDTLNAALGTEAPDMGPFDISLPQLCTLAREIMAATQTEKESDMPKTKRVTLDELRAMKERGEINPPASTEPSGESLPDGFWDDASKTEKERN